MEKNKAGSMFNKIIDKNKFLLGKIDEMRDKVVLLGLRLETLSKNINNLNIEVRKQCPI